MTQFLSTPSARRATSHLCGGPRFRLYFYPRPPRGGRRLAYKKLLAVYNFYPRPPRGGRQFMRSYYFTRKAFLSTPSARRATITCRVHSAHCSISIHALREEGDMLVAVVVCVVEISIHALREEGDRSKTDCRVSGKNFYPRPPRGGRPTSTAPAPGTSNFYPRPPRGGRQQKQRQNLYFQTNYTTFCTNLEEP